MAEFTDQEKELLDKLRKGFESDAKTRSQLEPWQELIDRDETVNANRASAAAKIIEGFAGSWAAQYNFGLGSSIVPSGALVSEAVTSADPQGPPNPVRAKTSKLGLRGAPEINFVPYNWRTNTFGSKGPSLVGHPIGFQIVGPTLKSPVMNWTWQVLEGAGPNGGDLLRMDVQSDGTANVMEPYAAGDLGLAYGPFGTSGWTIGDAAEPNGGLYVLIADDGLNPGSIPAGRVPMAALDRFVETARYELFRVASLPTVGVGDPYEIELHPDKSLSTYFDLPAVSIDRSIRAITMVRPYVARLQAVPQSGAAGGNDGESVSGREQAFVVVSPERAASGDNFPPFQGPAVTDGTWIQGGFTDSRQPGTTTAGEPSAYGGAARLPVPIPVQEASASVEKAFVPTVLVGQWAITVPSLTPYTTGLFASQFPIVNITVTQRSDDLPALSQGSIPSCLGWFDAVTTNVAPDRVFLNRVPETDPQTGLTYWGPGPWVNSLIGTQTVGLLATLHEPISSLWVEEFNLDAVEASRVKTMIDPQWVGRFEKQISDPLLVGLEPAPPPGSGPGRADRAIFDTRSVAAGGPIPNAENPGNLMDLGFRMVLFPAKPDPNDITQTIPNFDLPITGRELVIDGSINEKQYIDIDYSSGVVRLSHPPPESRTTIPSEPSDVIPTGISGLTGNNPRGEVVLFAACVPYSMEDSQVGTGVRLTASDGDGLRDFDAYSTEVSAKIDLTNTVFSGVAPFFGPSVPTGLNDIILDRLWDGPETGVLTIAAGSNTATSFGRWGYTTKTTVTPAGGVPVTALGGITARLTAADPDPSLFPGEQTRNITLRREVVFSRDGVSIPALSDFVSGDTYYGSSTRADTLRFERASLVPQLDGSMSVRPRPDLAIQLDRATGHILPAKLSLPLDTVVNPVPPGAPGFPYFSEQGVFAGLSYQADAGNTAGINGGLAYNAGILPGAGTDNRGPDQRLAMPGAVLPLWHGVITQDGGTPGAGSFFLSTNFRFVAKIGVEFLSSGATSDATGFVGLIQDATGPFLTPVVSTLSDPALAPVGHHYIGFQFDTTAPPVWRFWTRGSSGVDNIISTAAVVDRTILLTLQGPFYFVIESPRIGATDVDSVIVKMGVYDANKVLLSNITLTNKDLLPAPSGRGFFTSAAVREEFVPLNRGVNMLIYSMSIVFDTDIDDLPPLP